MGTLSLEAEAAAIIRDAWAAYEKSGDPRDLAIAKDLARFAAQADAVATQRPKLSPVARKRKAFKRGVRLNADAPILAQVRDLAR